MKLPNLLKQANVGMVYQLRECKIKTINVLKDNGTWLILDYINPNIHPYGVAIKKDELDKDTYGYWTASAKLINARLNELQARVDEYTDEIILIKRLK